LKCLHDLLKPGGSLVFMDVSHPQLWTETVFGLTSGWWRFTDSDLRQDSPLLERSQWEQILAGAGFEEVVSLPGLIGPEGEGQIGLLAQKAAGEVASHKVSPNGTLETPADTSWLIFGDEAGLGDRLAQRLRKNGARCRIVHQGVADSHPGVAYTT